MCEEAHKKRKKEIKLKKMNADRLNEGAPKAVVGKRRKRVVHIRCAALKTGQFVSIAYYCAKMDY